MATFNERIENLKNGPKVKAARVEGDQLHLTLASGALLALEARRLRALSELSDEQISDVRVTSGGTGLLWPKAGASIAVEALLEAATGMQSLKSAQRKGGSSRSEAKVAAVRANGAKGGRPRKTPATQP